ncbi:MAG: aspartate carbamoyltransferase catalytic subunit [Deltaproteobacteria bacterium]|nr:aspartate carbamoyltransferase catalytic subunit [Deltaproteobacteria bacterium]
MQFARKHILDMESLSVEEINVILDTAERMKEISKRPVKKVPTLRGKTVVLFFYEPSTRTRTSFDIAAKRLSADSLTLSGSSSSIVKGETLLDTARTLEAMNPDAVIIRHSSAGAPHMLSKMTTIPIINAGDGMHAHPTQSLLDLMTVVEKKGKVSGLNIAIIGDISHSRVARSNCIGFKKLGAHITLAGPPTMIPKGIMLRIQKERQKSYLFPSEREYAKVYGLTKEKLKKAKADVLIMHPGPVNRGVEIAPEVADGPYSIILDQVTNGVAVRMAILYLIVGGARDATAD